MRYNKDQYLLAASQLLAHIALFYVLLYGGWVDWSVTLLGFFLLGCLGTTVTYHRLLSHRSWNSPRWFEYLGTVLGSFSLIGSSIAWVALHKQHHRYTDKEGDF
jgi:stearoyl-CoA desaturase (delta-9 desaturase)